MTPVEFLTLAAIVLALITAALAIFVLAILACHMIDEIRRTKRRRNNRNQ